ncbi:hypothetical protein E1301_Tti011971 [Triplophysa tibetana]|uniref:Uncharacterized protein n=1 Tax=Triplophysa tibetana TaxID=1572043 RepID=A0A5A9PNR6_9TELE|nr:hypothetical protein E1301_Tti011971 [Triplophysa tibetana]
MGSEDSKPAAPTYDPEFDKPWRKFKWEHVEVPEKHVFYEEIFLLLYDLEVNKEMGSEESKSAAPTYNPEFDKPWRNFKWEDQMVKMEKDFLQYSAVCTVWCSLQKVKVSEESMPYKSPASHCLLSSKTFNILRLRSASLTHKKSETPDAQITSWTISRLNPGYFISHGKIPLVFVDIMGLEPDVLAGSQPEDIIKAVYGHVKDGYKLKGHFISRGKILLVFVDIMGLEPNALAGSQPEDIIKAVYGHVKDGYKYRSYYIRGKENTDILPFVFSDFMGLEEGESRGAHIKDVVKALRGLLTEGCKLNPTPVSSGDTAYRSEPGPQDQTFCLVYIIAADKVSFLNLDVIKKMKNIRESASGLVKPNVTSKLVLNSEGSSNQ